MHKNYIILINFIAFMMKVIGKLKVKLPSHSTITPQSNRQHTDVKPHAF